MSGLKTNWATGDVVTAEKLNAMQYAVVNILSREATGGTEEYYLDMTAGELLNLLSSGTPVFFRDDTNGLNAYGLVSSGSLEEGYTFGVSYLDGGSSTYGCGSADEYPVDGYRPNINS